jgi:hypothetical protein
MVYSIMGLVICFALMPVCIMVLKQLQRPDLYAKKHFSVFFIRHAEKPECAYNHHTRCNELSELGFERAASYYPSLFCDHDGDDTPDCMFETNLGTILAAKDAEPPHYTMREIETLEPLGKDLNKIVERVAGNRTEELHQQVMGVGFAMGLPNGADEAEPIAAIISWEHVNMKHLAKEFGCSKKLSSKKKKGARCPHQTNAWPDDDFGSIVKFVYTFQDANPRNIVLTETVTYTVTTLEGNLGFSVENIQEALDAQSAQEGIDSEEASPNGDRLLTLL